VLPAALWAEIEGTYTNYQRRVQRLRVAVLPPGDAQPRWQLAAAILERLGQPLGAASAREVFSLLAAAQPDYASLDYRSIGSAGRPLAPAPAGGTGAAQEARA
jgi:predicted molibdopterin-dependent oxidoreductase YjgC